LASDRLAGAIAADEMKPCLTNIQPDDLDFHDELLTVG
jgi:hypothetical protein